MEQSVCSIYTKYDEVEKPQGPTSLAMIMESTVKIKAILLSGSKEPRSALESRRVSLGAHWVDSRESSLLRRLERGRELGR